MKTLIFLTILLGLASCDFPLRSDWQSIPPAREDPELQKLTLKMFGTTKLQSRYPKDGIIVNGQLAATGQFPYQVLMYQMRADGAWFWCGSVIISNWWFLTAAHCIHLRVQAEAYAGMIDRQATAPYFSGTIPSANFRIHPQYGPALLDNDIGLVMANSPISFNILVSAIQLPLRAHAPLDLTGRLATASGFGAMQAGERICRKLWEFSEILTFRWTWFSAFTVVDSTCGT